MPRVYRELRRLVEGRGRPAEALKCEREATRAKRPASAGGTSGANQASDRDDYPDYAGRHAHYGEEPFFRDEIQRAQHQPDLQQTFADVVTKRAVLVTFGGIFRLLGGLLNLLALLFVFLLLRRVVSAHLLSSVAIGMHHGQQVLAQIKIVVLDASRLVVLPLVVGGGFVHDGGCVSSVRLDSYDREGDGQDGSEDSDLLAHRIRLV